MSDKKNAEIKSTEKFIAKSGAAGVQVVTAEDLEISQPQKVVSSKAFSAYVRTLSQNRRQGTVACKGRSDVSYSTRKPWRQKGTGRARAGSARSPLWRGGGVIFGPQRRVVKLAMPKKAKKSVLNKLLWDFLQHGKILSLEKAVIDTKPKTSVAYNLLKNAGLVDKKLTLFVAHDDESTYASFANIPSVQILYFDQPNAFDLANCEYWLFMKKDFDLFKQMVLQ